jgi:hypothetical protein
MRAVQIEMPGTGKKQLWETMVRKEHVQSDKLKEN